MVQTTILVQSHPRGARAHTINHQRIGSISDVDAGGDFETIAAAHFLQFEGPALQPRFAIRFGVGAAKKSHRFDLGCEDQT